MLENGYNITNIEQHFGICKRQLGYLSALLKKKDVKVDYPFRVQVDYFKQLDPHSITFTLYEITDRIRDDIREIMTLKQDQVFKMWNLYI